MDAVQAAAAAWGAVGLTARRAELDQQSNALVDAQEHSARGREVLKTVVRDFKAVPAAERPGKVGCVIKAFQAEVDALSRRAAFAEAAFLSLHTALDAVPDPAAPLALATTELATAAKAQAAAAAAQAELAQYAKEVATLKNQDLTVRRLQAQLREADDARDALVAAQLTKRLEALDGERAAADAAVCEREREAKESIDKAAAELRALAAERDEAHARLFRLREETDARTHAQAQQLELMLSELAAAREAAQHAEQERARLHAALAAATSGGGGGGGACELGANPSAASASAAAEVANVRAAQRAAESARDERRTLREATERALAAKDAELEAAGKAAAAAEADAHAARADADALRARCVSLELAAAGRGGAARGGVDPAAAGAVAAAGGAVEREETERQLARARADAADAARALELERARARALERALRESRQVTEALEATLLKRGHGKGAAHAEGPEGAEARQQPGQPAAASALEQLLAAPSHAPTAVDAAAASARGASAASAADAELGAMPTAPAEAAEFATVLVSQRNRFKAEAAERAADASRMRAQLLGAQGRAESLAADNIRLYERLHFLENYAQGDASATTPSGQLGSAGSLRAGSGGASSETVGKYRALYEESLNPFAAFAKRERLQRYQELNGAERLMLSMSSVLLASKRARMGLVVYMLVLHACVYAAIYGFSHVRTCDRTRAALALAQATQNK